MQNTKRKLPELLAPAGNFEKLTTAIHYGADAVYLGGKRFGLRAHATNYTEEELGEAVAYAHARQVKVYATANIFAHNRDLADLEKYLLHLARIGADGVIISDPGGLSLARRLIPGVPVHLSTQANVTNLESARFWERCGVARLNLARELSLTEIQQVRQEVEAELETFVHGALCISYSGRCLLSQYLTGRSANQGDCAHPCRYRYALLEEKRPGQYFPVEEDERGTYIFNARDLCLLARLPELIEAGVNSFKIEGRMKGIYYVGGVVRVYRAALDYLAAVDRPDPAVFPDRFLEELAKVGTRGATENFFSGPPGADGMLFGAPRLQQPMVLTGAVRRAGSPPEIEIRNTTRVGDRIEYLGRGLSTEPCTIIEMRDQATGQPVIQANPGNRILLTTSPPAVGWDEQGLLRGGVIS